MRHLVASVLLISLFHFGLVVGQPNANERGLFPVIFNLAANALIDANATCGENGAETYCKLVEHIPGRPVPNPQCRVCDAYSLNPRNRHSVENAIDGTNSWWQSPPISNGLEYHFVTITLDLQQIFQVAYVILKAANSPRPGNWVLEKSIDGINFQPWQYYAMSDSECLSLYNIQPTIGNPHYSADDEVICTSFYSKLNPLENGEIHTSLVNGRPSVLNPSSTLLEFTSARFIRVRLQRIRTLNADLMTLTSNEPGYVDTFVSRRYYYSIKDISIGGQCICFGHASVCPQDPVTLALHCECEHNTCGDQCQVCCPGYRQKPWRPGTQETGNICEACNCHGHATDCYYDQGVADRGESLNIYSEYDGGGVCIDCLDNTMGINCEVCLDRYYRPSGVARTDPNPCRLCNCNAYGIREEPGYVLGSCVKDDSNVEEGLNPGDCFCREGYSGAHCDRCARGYKGFPDCQKCPCSIAGSVNEDVCEPPCVCKANVVGVDCDVCTPGFFNLAEDNPSGCTECFCFGITEVCVSTTLPNEQITLQDGWTITDKAFTQQMFVTTTEDDNSVLSVVYADAKRVIGSDVLYWSAPQEYLGNKLKSYGGVLTYTVGYDIIDGVNISTPILDSDVIVKGGDTTIKQRPIRWVVPGRSETFEIAFTEQTWFHEESDRYVSKVEFMSLLANLESILIRATYHTAHLDSRISDISLDIAADNVNNTNIMSSVEQCNCPSGYAGLSCEECITGYRRINGELFEGICVPCDCNGHAAECDDITGECIECQHNTYGTNCEFCVPGYYGDANVGTPGDCKRCACPLKESSNNFSPTCQEGGDTDSFYCDQCQPGYEGPRCDRCSDGYYGNPLVLNDTCKPCMFNCNNNLDVNSEGNCNSISGECLKCINNTAGAYCGRCIDGYYGDAIVEKNCQVCQCYRPGAVTEICDHRTGQCECKPHVIGQHCNICETGYWDILSAQGCNPCNCNLIGSLGVECDIIQGQCYCKPGVQGRTCDHCLSGYYNFTEDGCTLCDCERTGGSCDAQTGECICPPNTIGMRCEQCAPDTWGYDQISGCKMCNCSEDGSSGSQCNIITGQCDCLADYRGRECNQCQFGFRDFPRCRECKCNNKGTDDTGCNEDGLCGCSDEGQCECKDHVTGKRCNKCVEYSFGLREDLATGCTECFCFGITKVCQQADYVRDQIVVTAADNGFFVSDDRSIVQTQAGVVFTPDEVRLNATATLNSLDTPTTLYWNLPQIFLGNKITAYGGRLRYSVQYSGIDIGEDTVFDILIKGPQQTLVKQLLNPFVGVPQTYDLELVETEWQLRDAEKAPRDLFMMVLQNIQSIMIRATYSKDTIQSVLRDVSMEVGIPRSDNPSLSDALGVESCECPVGYIGISCEECAAGYVRVSNGPYLGSCRPCTCNEHGSMCDPNTGICEDCQDHTRGPMCETCEEGYYGNATNGTPDDCQPCACPLKESSNNFSPTCVLDNDGSHRCTDCDTGYTGRYCDSCEDGYYGNPSTLGDRCEECDCNEQGATSQICDKQSGQCDCEPGLRGRACDVCQTRHVLTPEGCTSCDDTCTGLLLDEIEALTAMLETPNITGIVPAPWPRLRALVNETEILGPRLESYKNAKKAAAQIVMSLPTGVSGLQDEMDELLQRSEEMKDKSGQVNDQTSISNDRAMDVEKLLMDTLAKLKGLINELEKLVDSLSSQPAMENEALLQEAQDILDEIMARDFSDQELAAEDELQSAKDALKKAKKKFMRKVEENKELTDRVNGTLMDLMMKFMELIEESQQSEKTSDDVIKQNDANNDMINNIQDKINEIKKNQGEIVGILDMGRQLLEDAADLLAEGYVALEETVVQAEGLKDSLPDLKNKVGLLQQNMIGLPELVVRAERHARELADFANYLEDLFQDTRDLAEIPVQAAEVYNDIVETLDDANKTAHEAKMLADEALKQASEGTGTEESLADRAMNSKARSESLVEGAEKKTDKVLELEDRLEDVKKDIDTIKSSSETIKTTNDAIKAELPNFDKELSQKAQDALQKARGASVAAAAAKQKTQDVVDLLPTQKQKFETLQDNTVNTNENMDIAERSLNRVQNALGQLQDLTDTMATKAAAIRQLQSLMANNLTEIKDKIEQARGQAKSIKVSVGSSATCIRAYRPEVSASFHNKIVINFKTTTADNLLLYIGSSETADDYMSMETIQGKVKFQWDVGAGIGSATHPLSVTDGQWYKAEAERNGRAGSLSVQLSTANTEPDIVIGQAPTGYTVLDIDSSSDLFIGGVPDNFENNALSVKLFSGCIGETLIDDSVVGLWNFKDSEGECSGCKESPRPSPTADTYQFDGTGHVIMPKIRNWNTETTELQLDFRSFDEDALLFYIAAEDKKDYMSVELSSGQVLFKYDLGGGEASLLSPERYNTGEWVRVSARRRRQSGRLSLNNEEVASGKSQGTLTGLTISTEMYIGGVPTGFDIRTGVSEKSFTGCMREFLVNRNAQEFGSQNIASLGVTDGCIKKAIRNVGIMGEGYVELPPVDLGKDGDITISFATYQPDALLLLAKSINNKRKRQVNLDASGVYYSIMLKNGRLQVQLNAGFGGVLLTTRKSDGTFNDGEFHVVSIVKEDNSVKISVDDTAFRGGKIPSGPNEISVNVLTIGGVRSEYKDKVGDAADVINAFSGCIQDIVINGILQDMSTATSFEKADLGHCAPVSATLPPTVPEGPLQPPAATMPSELKQQTEMPIKMLTEMPSNILTEEPGMCSSPVDLELVPGTVQFGKTANSHMSYDIEKKSVKNKFQISVEVKTYVTSGVVFYIGGFGDGTGDFTSLQIVNRQPVFMFDNGGGVLVLESHRVINDGQFHSITVIRNRLDGTIVVDGSEYVNGTAPGLATSMNIDTGLYIGGVPQDISTPRLGTVTYSLDGCIRNLKLQNNVLDVESSTTQVDVTPCTKKVEDAAYFNGNGFLVLDEKFRVGSDLTIDLKFRTTQNDGLLLSVANDQNDCLGLELVNGKLTLRTDNGAGAFSATYTPESSYTLCDNMWHTVKIVKVKNALELVVDGHYQGGANEAVSSSADTNNPLYFAGYPDTALQQKCLTTDIKFMGCIGNVIIQGQKQDFRQAAELVDVRPSSCPVK